MHNLTFTLSLVALLFTATISANDEPLVTVSYKDAAYITHVSTHIDAEPNVVYQLLTSYDRFNDFSRLIKKSERLSNGNLLLKLEVCFAFICFKKQQTLALTLSENSITGRIIPAQSDFKSGWMTWTLSKDKNNSSFIQFSSELTPDFWIPPFIGPLIIQHKFKGEAQYSVEQLERLAIEKTQQ